jgi:hypothetical protein
MLSFDSVAIISGGGVTAAHLARLCYGESVEGWAASASAKLIAANYRAARRIAGQERIIGQSPRALAPTGEARLRLRDHGNLRRVRSALRPPTPLASPFGDFGTCTFPTTPARFARALSPFGDFGTCTFPTTPARFARALSPFGDFGTCTFPTTPARFARALALGLAKTSRALAPAGEARLRLRD